MKALLAALLLLPACGGCGDDTAAEPDAEVTVAPDAEVPDAEAPDAMPDPAPAPVTGFTAGPGDPVEVDASWTNPTDADLAGVLVVVSADPITFAPTDGTTYTANQDLGDGQAVLFASAGTAATITPAVLGRVYRLRAWAFDAGHHYSVSRDAIGGYHALGTQTATLEISLAGVVTVTSQPANLALSGTATYFDADDEIELQLTVQNDTARLLFNLKALTTAQNEGVQGGPTFPLVGGDPSTYFGPEAIDVGASETRLVLLGGITGAADPITLTLSFVDAPMLFTGDGSNNANLYGGDTSGSGESFNDGEGPEAPRQGVISADGRFLYVGSKNDPRVTVTDTTTYTRTSSAVLGDAAGGIGGIGGVALSTDGSRLYAIVNDGAHWHGSDGQGNAATGAEVAETEVQVVELLASDLSEVQRLTLHTADTSKRLGRALQLSPDGTRLAVAVSASGFNGTTSLTTASNELVLIDLETFTVADTIALQSTLAYAHQLAWDGDSIYVGFHNDPGGNHLPGVDDAAIGLEVVDATTGAVSTIAAPTGAGSVAHPFVARGGKVYYASGDSDASPTQGFHVIDGASVIGPTGVPTRSSGIAFDPNGARYYVVAHRSAPVNGGNVVVMDAVTDTPIDTDGDGTNGATGFSIETANAHLVVVSPF